MDKNKAGDDPECSQNLEIYIDFRNDLTLIAHMVNDLVIYSIQNEEVLCSSVKNISFFNDLIQNGNWKRFTNF
jgi:hypothetical protein